MATLALTNDEIRAEIGFLLGISRDPLTWDVTTTGDVDRIIRSGRRRFFSATDWKFLRQPIRINTTAPFSGAQISITNGVVSLVTLGSEIFPTDTTDYVLVPEQGGVYAVASRDSDTQLTLHDTTVNAVTLSSNYKLYRIRYALPADFGGWRGPIAIENYDGRSLNESRNLPDYVLRSFANMERPTLGTPSLFSLDSVVDAETAIATYGLTLYPLPEKVYVLVAEYRVSPGDTLELPTSSVISNPIFSECYKEAILSAAEVMAFDRTGVHSQRFAELLGEAIRLDSSMADIRIGRPRCRGNQRSPLHELLVGEVDFSSQVI